MTDDSGFKTKKLLDAFAGFIKGNKWYFLTQGKNYTIKFPASGVVNVLGNGPSRANRWIFRIDRPHKGVPYNHLNINPRSSGLPTDPHIPLPSGTLPVSRGVARFCQAVNQVNKVAIPLAIAIDTYRTAKSMVEDAKNGTSRNTVETVSSVAGGWGGGYGGAVAGAALGSAFLPGIGTIVGGIFGAISGGIGGALGASKIVNSVGDAYDYDVIAKKCKECGVDFKVLKYRREIDSPFCEDCRIEEEIEIEIRSDNLISLGHAFPKTKIPKWPNFTLDALVGILNGKAAIFYVCIPEIKFVEPKFKSACFKTGKEEGTVVVVATSKSWIQSDVEAAIMGFEYAARLCIQIVSDVTKIDTAKVFDSLHKLLEGKGSEDSYEMIVVYRNELLWQKPDWSHLDDVMSNLVCAGSEKNVNLVVDDKRKVKNKIGK